MSRRRVSVPRTPPNLTFCHAHTDIHLRNILARLPRWLDQLSVEQFYEEYGKPETISVTRCDGKPIPANVPSAAVAPLNLGEGKRADEFSLSDDTQVLLSDFGEAFAPGSEFRAG